MDSSNFITLCVIVMVIAACIRAIYEHHLLKTSPEAWKAMKAAQEDAKERKRKAMGTAAVGGLGLLARFMKK